LKYPVLHAKVLKHRPLDIAGEDAVQEVGKQLGSHGTKVIAGNLQVDGQVIDNSKAPVLEASDQLASQSHADVCVLVGVCCWLVLAEKADLTQGPDHGDLSFLDDISLVKKCYEFLIPENYGSANSKKKWMSQFKGNNYG